MKLITTIIMINLFFISCQNNKESMIMGQWEEYEMEPNYIEGDYPRYFSITKTGNELIVIKSDGNEGVNDSCMNVLFDGNELIFKHDRTHYRLVLSDDNNILIGEKKYFQGISNKIKFKKIIVDK